MKELRYAARVLRRAPVFTATAIAALAIGIGANTAIFSLVNGVLLRALPFRDADRIVVIWERNIPRDRKTNVAGPANYLVWHDRATVFTDMAATTTPGRAALTGAGDPLEVRVQYVTAGYFPVLGVSAEQGRAFTAAEDETDAPVAVVSHRLWSGVLGHAAPGSRVTIDGRARELIGVMPAGFELMDPNVDAWLPIHFTAASRVPRGRYLIPLARLKPGVTLSAAQAQMDTISAALTAQYPAFDTGWTTRVVPLPEQLRGPVRPALLVLLAAVGLVLLIACANVANLQLARATSRRRELSVRAAIGAGRLAIVRQLLAESLLLAAGGMAAGVALAWIGLRALVTAVAAQVTYPGLDRIHIDGFVLLVTAAIALVAAVAFGLFPALTASKTDLALALKNDARTGSSGGHGRVRDAFVVIELSLALVLLVGAGLLGRSFASLMATDPGFDASGVLTLQVTLPPGTFQTPAQRGTFYQQALDALGTLPQVTDAGAVSFLPMNGLGAATSFTVVGQPKPAAGQEPVADVRVITRSYFEALRVPLLQGRLFTAREDREPSRVVIVNATLARQVFGGENPIGRRITLSWNDPGEDEIVGVVGDMKLTSLDEDVRPAAYLPYSRTPYPSQIVVLRTADPVATASLAIRRLHDVDPNVPISHVRTMSDVIAASIGQRRIVTSLLGLFAAAALLLAAVGIYGVLSYVVSLRTREIGIRMALGAPRARVVAMVLGHALRLAALGVAVGAAGAFAATRLMSAMLFHVTATDPLTFGTVALLLTATAAAAALVPTLTASRVDPMLALRSE